LSNAIDECSQDIARAFQKCSNSWRKLRRSIRGNLNLRTTNGSTFAVANGTKDSEFG
jgi:hypothetical protein